MAYYHLDYKESEEWGWWVDDDTKLGIRLQRRKLGCTNLTVAWTTLSNISFFHYKTTQNSLSLALSLPYIYIYIFSSEFPIFSLVTVSSVTLRQTLFNPRFELFGWSRAFMDSQVLVALALSLVGGLSTSLGELNLTLVRSRTHFSIFEFQLSHFFVLVFVCPNLLLGMSYVCCFCSKFLSWFVLLSLR